MPWHDGWKSMRGDPVGLTFPQLVGVVRDRIGEISPWRIRRAIRETSRRPRICRGRGVYGTEDIEAVRAYAGRMGWIQGTQT